MMHASGRTRFATKALLRGLVTHESLTQDFDCDRSIDQQMRGAIDSTHAASAESLVQTILAVEDSTNQRIDQNVGDRGIGLQRCEVVGTHVHVVRKLPATSGTLGQ